MQLLTHNFLCPSLDEAICAIRCWRCAHVMSVSNAIFMVVANASFAFLLVSHLYRLAECSSQQPAPFCCINDKRLPASPIQLRLVTSTSTINGMNAKSHTYAVRIAYDSSTELQTISNLHVCHPLREPYAILVAATGKSFTQNDWLLFFSFGIRCLTQFRLCQSIATAENMFKCSYYGSVCLEPHAIYDWHTQKKKCTAWAQFGHSRTQRISDVHLPSTMSNAPYKLLPFCKK